MRSLLLVTFGALVVAVPSKTPSDIGSGIVPTAQQMMVNRNYTKAEVHENVMANHPTEWIINSESLNDYLAANIGSNHTIYVSDQQKWISMSSVKPVQEGNSTVGKRTAGPPPCNTYTSTFTEQTQSFWSSWNAASGCQYTGDDPAGGTFSQSWSYTREISENAGLDWDTIQDVLSASVGFEVSQSWSYAYTLTCNIPGNSVGQVWEQNFLGWGWFWSQTCETCSGCQAAYVDGGATAPMADYTTGVGFNLGCSTGSDNVSC